MTHCALSSLKETERNEEEIFVILLYSNIVFLKMCHFRGPAISFYYRVNREITSNIHRLSQFHGIEREFNT